MKELSIEEKAKRYDEAVINGSRLWECDKITREDYEFIFPTLKESEDERIRENIIATIHLYYGEPLEDEAKEMIAWLERRGQTFTKKDVDDAYLKGVCDAKHELEKQGKNNMGISEATKQKLEDNLNKALEKETPESWNKFLDEQKPTDVRTTGYWHVEDVEQKPAWSEEDEKFFKTALWHISNSISNGTNTDIHCDTTDWLKSLKERYSWKPSDEQMVALDSAIHCYAGISPTNNREVYSLEIMKEQLKKLREE